MKLLHLKATFFASVCIMVITMFIAFMYTRWNIDTQGQIAYLDRVSTIAKQQKQATLQKMFFATNNEFSKMTTQATLQTTKEEALPHRTYLISRTHCAEKIFLLMVVFTAPAHFDRRNIIRKTWAHDPSLQARWKTMFLLGQAVDNKVDNTLTEYLKAEGLIYNDFIRGAQRENYYNLTLKTQMGLEWAAKYCDFQFLLKIDDDVFVNPYRLMDYLKSPNTPKTELYFGYVMRNGAPHRSGKYAVTVEEYNKTRYPDFCSGPAYVLSSDLVHKLIDLFDVKKPLKLEDVYIATLVEKLGVKAVRHPGFHSVQYGPCHHYKDTVVYHTASVKCIEELFDEAMKERVKQELENQRSVVTGRDEQLPVPANGTKKV